LKTAMTDPGLQTDPEPEGRQAAVLLAAIDALRATLDVAAALVTQGRRIDLSGLEEEASRLCAAALAAPPAAVPAVRRGLESLCLALDRLQASLAPP
jgi:hypothetical protein